MQDNQYKKAMLKLQTPVEIRPGKVKVYAEDRILVLGSCFADNVGRKMKDIGMDVCVNPFGTLYNPASVLSAMDRLCSGKPFEEYECRLMGSGAGLICSFSHHTSFARRTIPEFLDNANAALDKASEFYRTCSKVIITLGTSWCYRHVEDGIIVSNCLKRNASEFERLRLGVEESEEYIKGIIGSGAGKDCRSDREFIFTVSPIRHLKDGAHENQLSKASLLLAVDRVCSDYSGCDYFPAYEIVMDELRDYRFYAEDMVHPSQQTIEYIWERFCDAMMPEPERAKVKALEKKFRQSCHRPNIQV